MQRTPRSKAAPLAAEPTMPLVPVSPRGSLSLSPSRAGAQSEQGKWQVFSDATAATFKSVPSVELTIPNTTVDVVVKTLMAPKWWESEDKHSSTNVSLVGSLHKGRIIYLRNVKSAMGPAKFRLRLWTTQWAEQLPSGEGACVVAHCFDEFEACHLISSFFVTVDAEKPDSVMVKYDELTSSPKMAVKLAHNKIKRAHLFVLEILARQVQELGVHVEDPFPTLHDLSSQRSNTDAVNDLTSISDALDDDDSFDNEDGQIVIIHWQELPLDDVRMQMSDPNSGIRVGSRSWRLKTYHNVFVGNEAVDWLVERYPLSRDGAVLLCRELRELGWIRHVKNDHDFKDDHLFFVWRDPVDSPRGFVNEIEMQPMSISKLPPLPKSEDLSGQNAPKNVEKKEPIQVLAPRAPRQSSPISLLISRVMELSMEHQIMAICAFFGAISWLMNWNTLFLMCTLAGSYFAWKSGQNSVDRELRRVNNELRDLQEKLAVSIRGNDSKSSESEQKVLIIEPDRNVEQLISRHRQLIDSLRSELGAEINEKEHDDLFLLRYVLSFKSKEPALEAIRKCLAWRSENQKIIDLVNRGEEVSCRSTIMRYAVSDHHMKPLADGSPLLVTRAGLCDLASLLNNVEMSDLVEWLMWLNEYGSRECDRVTRATGRLTKIVRVNDLNHASILQDRGFFSAIGKASKVASYVYPQLVEKNVLLNAPSLISIVLKVAAQFVSPNTMSKVGVCRGKTMQGNIADCPFASRRFRREDLPLFMGGSCGSDIREDAAEGCRTGKCIQGAPNLAESRDDLPAFMDE